eukprot:Blabericola_migrator_1__2356@NODE_165_length_12243_cov_242_656784_g143_i0_p1_GENE_NODE_165_length_12243_cov_242_656784_g143_i0NODE_165_length_12243_cov_242_656784_g143_i0_p1_ORF_typecomplete_len1430_score309_28Glycos_transf_1/PF00534_20/1_1e40Glyco_trans_1_4/PF13692_6/9_9e30Glyco_transf_4/PF13439_6/6_7e03Glyco_transf_4/PF13439_6/2_8e26Glyco_transf_4/PF13439_6/1_2e04Glyco_transf_4/PF13439_6/1_3e04Alphaamylase/PF00128_24/3_7e24Glyco_trans_4_4/PF13579_6/5_3e03Glyco_trans_4_4/PF13579_6/1_8e20CBM_48/
MTSESLSSSSTIDTGRRQHITRLPSSAFLTSALKDKLSNQVRIVTFHIKESHPKWFVNNWEEVTHKYPASSAVVWDLYQESDNERVFYLIARTVPEDDEKPPEVRRQASGMLNQRSTLESTISDWIAKVQPALERPCRSAHLSTVLQSKGQLASPNFTICFESIRVRVGLEMSFSEFLIETLSEEVTQEETSRPPLRPAIKAECNIDIEYAAFQDITDTAQFDIIYYFKSTADVLTVRESSAWVHWRRRIGAFITGAPRVFNLTKYLHGDEVITETDTGEVTVTETPPIETLPTETPVAAHHTVDYISDTSLAVADLAVTTDEHLAPHRDYLRGRYERYMKRVAVVRDDSDPSSRPSYTQISSAHKEFGLHRVTSPVPGYRYREMIGGSPESVYLYGDFNQWNKTSHPMSKSSEDVWEIFVPDASGLKIEQRQKYKFLVVREDGSQFDRISPWARLAWEAQDTHLMDAIVFESRYNFRNSRPPIVMNSHPKIYEAHVGLASAEEKVGTYIELRLHLLPWLKALGYDTLLLVGILEHANYPSGGWHVTSYYAPSSRFGTPDEFKELIDEAHGQSIKVLLSVVYSHAGPNKLDGLGNIDETDTGLFFRSGLSGDQRRWDARVFNYKSEATMKFLYSNMRFWLEEYMLDGFRFEGLESILYKDHGINNGFDRYDYTTFFNTNSDTDGAAFLMVANDLIHTILPQAVTIGNCSFGTPTLATPISKGGLGFDYTQSNHLQAEMTDVIERVNRYEGFSLKALRFSLDRMSAEKRVGLMQSVETMTISKRPMKVAFMAWETLHTIAVGGIAPHVTELAAALRRVGHELHVYTRATGVGDTVSNHYGVYYHEIAFRLDRDFIQECQNMCDAFVRAIQADEVATNRPYTLIHGHDWLVGRGVIAFKGLGRTVVFTMHSTEAGRCGNQVFGGQSQRIRDIEASACSAADRVICVSGVLADEVKRFYGIHPQKIRVVYNGCNVHNFDGFEDAAPIKQRYGINPLEPTILFVGRFVVQKGVDLLVEAIPSILKFRGDVKFVIVGDGHMRDAVEARSRALGVHHAVRFLGAKGGAELKSLFKMCDAVAVPSRNEPFGIVVLEAWSAYKPVIATTCGGPRDFVSPNRDGVLVDPNPGSIAWGVCETLKNFEHTRWMGVQGRLKAENLFTWDQIGTQTRDIYYELMNLGDTTYGTSCTGNCTLAQRIMGSALYSHMTIFDEDATIMNGLAFLRLLQLATFIMGSEATLNAMGNEFAHPDWIDYPRPGNNFSQNKARIQWDLSLKKNLKYKHMLLFSKVLMAIDSDVFITAGNDLYITRCSEEDKVLVVERSGCLVVFNFHCHNDYTDYGVGHSIQNQAGLKLVLSTDEFRFGGRGRVEADLGSAHIDGPPLDERETSIIIRSLPNRCAMIYATSDWKTSMHETPDDLIDRIELVLPIASTPAAM